MSFRQYMIIMSIATILCWIAWGFVIYTIDPNFANAASFAFFYLSLFLSVLGTASIIACASYFFFSNRLLPMHRYVQKSFRLALTIAASIVLLLYLQASKLLNHWIAGAFILGLVFVTLLLRFSKKQPPQFQT